MYAWTTHDQWLGGVGYVKFESDYRTSGKLQVECEESKMTYFDKHFHIHMTNIRTCINNNAHQVSPVHIFAVNVCSERCDSLDASKAALKRTSSESLL